MCLEQQLIQFQGNFCTCYKIQLLCNVDCQDVPQTLIKQASQVLITQLNHCVFSKKLIVLLLFCSVATRIVRINLGCNLLIWPNFPLEKHKSGCFCLIINSQDATGGHSFVHSNFRISTWYYKGKEGSCFSRELFVQPFLTCSDKDAKGH